MLLSSIFYQKAGVQKNDFEFFTCKLRTSRKSTPTQRWDPLSRFNGMNCSYRYEEFMPRILHIALSPLSLHLFLSGAFGKGSKHHRVQDTTAHWMIYFNGRLNRLIGSGSFKVTLGSREGHVMIALSHVAYHSIWLILQITRPIF